MRKALLALLLVLPLDQSLVLAAVPAAPAAPATSSVDASTAAQTLAGTTFKLPPGWTSSTQGQFVVLSPPEPDMKIALTDIEAKDAAAAAAAAWAAFDPTFKRPVRVMTPGGPRNGWEERYFVDYEVSPNEKLVVEAYAWRSGKTWFVGLLKSSEATAEKRGGPLGLVAGSLRPKGYQSESFAGKPAHPIDAKTIAAMKEFVAAGMAKLQVPGVGFSLIDGGKIVYEGGIGVRELGKPAPIDADTLFIAASNTKALGTLLLAELVDEKKLRWDEPATEAYPPFKLGDAATTQSVLIKHLVCACTGMPRQDLDWIFDNGHETPESAMVKLGNMQPTSKYGEVFQYSNLMAAAAGYIGGSIAIPKTELGKAYDEAMQVKVLNPLGMSHSTYDFKKAMQGDYARPHDVDIDGHLALGEMTLNYTIISLRPAGGIWTSAHDLSQYVMMELANGKLPNGHRLVSEQNLLERRKPNVVVSADVDYGMGLMIDKRWGATVIHHGGDLEGYHSDMMWLPEYNVGAVILTNSDTGYALRAPFLRKLVELMFDGKPEASAQLAAAAAQIEADRVKARTRLDVPAAEAAVAALAPNYRNDILGNIAIAREGKTVYFKMGTIRSAVASRKNDDGTISFITITPTMQGLEFVVGLRDNRRVLIVRDAQHEYVFREGS
jgi:CubicO group peptidase (beta-lactamase class C family)